MHDDTGKSRRLVREQEAGRPRERGRLRPTSATRRRRTCVWRGGMERLLSRLVDATKRDPILSTRIEPDFAMATMRLIGNRCRSSERDRGHHASRTLAYRAYRLAYAQSAMTGRSLLAAVTLTGFRPDGARHELPPADAPIHGAGHRCRRIWHSLGGALPGGSLKDRNLTLVRQSGSGLPDILETTGTGHWITGEPGPSRVRYAAAGCLACPDVARGRRNVHLRHGRQRLGRSRRQRRRPRLSRRRRRWLGNAVRVRTGARRSISTRPMCALADLNGDGLPDALARRRAVVGVLPEPGRRAVGTGCQPS